MKTQLPPGVEEHFADIPPEVSDILGLHVLSLSHHDLPRSAVPSPADWGVNPDHLYGGVLDNPPELTAEQVEHSERVQTQIERAALFVKSAYLEAMPGYVDRGSYILDKASDHAMRTAFKAKEAGDQQTAVEALESYLVLRTIGRGGWSVENVEEQEATVLEMVENGLADELVLAAHHTHGLVSVRPDTGNNDAFSIIPVGLNDGDEEKTVRLASTVDADPEFYRVAPKLRDPGGFTESEKKELSTLTPAASLSLAKAMDRQGDEPQRAAEAAMATIVEGVHQDYRPDTPLTKADTFINLRDICQRADQSSEDSHYQDDFMESLALVRKAREGGNTKFREPLGLDDLTTAVVGLVDLGEDDLAYQLISSSKNDRIPEELIMSNFTHPLQYYAPRDLEKRADLKRKINFLHAKKVEELTHGMWELGYSTETIQTIINRASDPDAFLRLQDSGTIGFLNRIEKQDFRGREDARVFISIADRDPGEIEQIYTALTQYIGDGLDTDDLVGRFLSLHGNNHLGGSSPEVVTELVKAQTPDSEATDPEELSQRLRRLEVLASGMARGFDLDLALVIGRKLYGPDTAIFEAITDNFDSFKKMLFLYSSHAGTEKVFFRDIKDVMDIFGADASFSSMVIVDMIKQGELGKFDSVELGVTKPGRRGIAQLKETFETLRADLAADKNITVDRIIASPHIFTAARSWWVGSNFRDVSDSVKGVLSAGTVLSAITNGDRKKTWELLKHVYGGETGAIDKLTNDQDMAGHVADIYFEGEESEQPLFLKHMAKAIELFGPALSVNSLRAVVNIMEGELPDQGREGLGITKSGEAGIEQLKAFVDKFKKQLFEHGKIPVELVINDPLALDVLKSIVRYEGSEWDTVHSDDDLIRHLERDRDHPVQVPAGYEIGEFRVQLTDADARRAFEISEDGISQWRSHIDAIQTAMLITDSEGQINWKNMGQLLSEIQDSAGHRAADIDKGLDGMRQKIAAMEEQGKDTTGITKRLGEQELAQTALRGVDYTNVNDFDITSLVEQVTMLAEHKDILQSGQLQTLLIAVAMAVGSANGNTPPMPSITPHTPHIDEVVEMSNFIGHLVNQETWAELFATVGGRKQLNQILNTDALEANIRRSSNIETSGTKQFRVIPAKGTLLELSGHISDACWATQYDSITDQFPNFTALTFVQNPESASRRVAGAALLIETTSDSGQPLLVIRGLNPLENVITQLSAESFYNEIVGYVKKIGQRTNRKVAIVIDQHSGGSGTNRPTLFAHLDSVRPNLQPVQLADADTTTFNNYDIVNQTYLVD